MIELQNLSKTFQSNGKTVTAVNDVSLTVNEGEICVFLGPSGCGKSTTLKMINRLIKPTSGKILINGEDTTDLNEVTSAPQHRLCDPADRPVPEHDHRGKHRGRAEIARLGQAKMP